MTDLLKPVLVQNSCFGLCPLRHDCQRGFIRDLKLCNDEAQKVADEAQKIEGVEFKFRSGGPEGHTIWIHEEGKEQFTKIVFARGERVRG